MKVLSDFRGSVRVYVGDGMNRRFSDDTIDMALRETLGIFRDYIPNKVTRSVNVDAVDGRELEISCTEPEEDLDGDIISVLRDCNNEFISAVEYRYGTKTLLMIYGSSRIPAAGETLTIELGIPHTIKGLDSAPTTTVPDRWYMTIVKGAAADALRIRARSVTEVFGKRPEDTENLIAQAETLDQKFYEDLGTGEGGPDPMPRGGWPI